MLQFLRKFWALLQREGPAGIYRTIRRRRMVARNQQDYQNMLKMETYTDRFNEIYRKNLWNSPDSASGSGSELPKTAAVRDWLTANLPKYGVKTIVDAPCGDFHWMRHVVVGTDLRYTGIDLVPDLIEKNRQAFRYDNVAFRTGDICVDRLPDCDLLFVRDCLFHLSYAHIDQFLKNLHRCNYSMIMLTTHLDRADAGVENKDIVSGSFRLLNLFKPPFAFQKDAVVESIFEFKEAEFDRHMLLLRKQDMPEGLQLQGQVER